MKTLLLLQTLLIATTFANPTPKTTWRDEKRGLEIRGLGDQGDGFYSAIFDKSGVATVKFTPWAELNVTKPDPSTNVKTDISLEAKEKLEKRYAITCTGEWANWRHLDIANIALANNAQTRGDYNGYGWLGGHWGWVHHEGVTAYFCPYGNAYIDYNVVISFNINISNKCGGSSALGWQRDPVWRNDEWYDSADASVGRTYRGRNFCTSSFYG